MTLSLGFSPCPNDTYLFYAWVHGCVAPDMPVETTLADIETLNSAAKKSRFSLTKLSLAAYPNVWQHYQMLPVGAAVTSGQGPKLISLPEDIASDPDLTHRLKGKKIAIPGEHTTAYWTLRLLYGSEFIPCFYPYHEILQRVKSGQVNYGLLIHETRTHFAHEGVQELVDLGQKWHSQYGLPLPLGALFIQRAFPPEMRAKIVKALRESLAYAQKLPEQTKAYVCRHAQESQDAVIQKHISLYVTHETKSLSELAQESMRHFFACGQDRGWWDELPSDWLWNEKS